MILRIKKQLIGHILRTKVRPYDLTNFPINRFTKTQARVLPAMMRFHLGKMKEAAERGEYLPSRFYYGLRLGKDRQLYAISTKREGKLSARLPFHRQIPMYWSRRFRKFVRNQRFLFRNRRTLRYVRAYRLTKAFKKGIKLSTHCFIYLKQTVNNTFITVRNRSKVLVSSSCGVVGFTGPRRPLPHSTTVLANTVGEKIRRKTCTIVLLSPITKHIRSAIVTLSKYTSIYQVREHLPIAHNGIRPRHIRRV